MIKKLLIALAAILVAYTGLSAFGAYRAMEIPRLPLTAVPDASLPYENISFPSRGEGVLLKGWLTSGSSDLAVIIVHGGFQNRVDDNVGTLNLAEDLTDRGFDVLLFDLRGRGGSEGKGRSLMNAEQDIGGAIDFLNNQGYADKSIGILGFCSGAASAVMYASTSSVGAMVLDGCFATVREMFKSQAALDGIPGFAVDIFNPGVTLMAGLLYDYRIIDPIDLIPTISCPVLFIHEGLDETISPEVNASIWQAAAVNSANEFWEIPAAKHSQGYRTVPIEYIDRLSVFLMKHLRNDRSSQPLKATECRLFSI